jgi:hypothetical protein
MACRCAVWLLLLLHAGAETQVTDHSMLDTYAKYMAAPVDASTLTKEVQQTQAALNLGEPSCHKIKGRQVCLPNAVQRQAAKQVHHLPKNVLGVQALCTPLSLSLSLSLSLRLSLPTDEVELVAGARLGVRSESSVRALHQSGGVNCGPGAVRAPPSPTAPRRVRRHRAVG